jgi:TctA family transporter
MSMGAALLALLLLPCIVIAGALGVVFSCFVWFFLIALAWAALAEGRGDNAK